ncbi:MAG: ATP-binding cassette domain-containing protein [Eubacteriales bacterium]|nr:ATP-binding cassette domain-containing protein [Eubacteriales bacterium]
MLKLENITYEVTEDDVVKRILDDVSVEFNEGFTAITGPNGGGKSTLAKVISGVITPTSGRIILDGEDITGLSITERAKKGISYAFQQPVRFKGITVRDLIDMACGKKVKLDEACEYLSSVGLCAKDYINREVSASLSGGELKRIEIATVIARSTRIALFDEPEAGIDLWSFNSLIKVFEFLRKKLNGAVILISHQERILSIADNIVVIDSGRVKTAGPRDEILPTLTGTTVACKGMSSQEAV